MKTKVNKIPPEILAIRIVEMLDRFKIVKPDAKITIETPSGTMTCYLADANIYTNDFNDIVVDSE